MADSIRERRAREVPEREGVVEEEWEEEEWEDEEWEPKTLIERVAGPLIDFITDVLTLATVPTALLLLANAYQATTFGLETALLLLFGATTATLMIANAKQKLLRRLRLS
jgi:hypothetical protein